MTMMNQHAELSKRFATQSVFNLKSRLPTVWEWLHRDMRKLPRWPVITLLAICISIAIATSSYLLWTHVTSSPIAGCGSGGGWIDCDGVAISRWSTWFGVPVSLLTLAIYVALAAALLVATSSRSSRQLLSRPPATFEIERYDSPPVDVNEAIEFAPPVNLSEHKSHDSSSLSQEPATGTNIPSDNRSYAGLLALSNLFAVDIVQADFTRGVQPPERVPACGKKSNGSFRRIVCNHSQGGGSILLTNDLS